MINIVSSKKLDIVLANTNKALTQVLLNATPKEIETISQGKDLKSIMNSILKQSSVDNSNDKILLELVKNNPTLKSLGNVTDTIKELLTKVKVDKNPLPIEKVLKEFLVDIKDLKNSELKQKFEKSGVFLESHLKDVKSPQVVLKDTLIFLGKILTKSEFSSAKTIINDIKIILNNQLPKEIVQSKDNINFPQIKKNIEQKEVIQTKELTKLASSVKNIVKELESAQKISDPLQKADLLKPLNKLNHLISPKLLNESDFKYPQVKELLQQLSTTISNSINKESKGLMDSLEKIFSAIKVIEQTPTIPKVLIEKLIEKEIPQDIKKLSNDIKKVISKADPIFSKKTIVIIDKLKNLSLPQQLNSQNNVKELLSTDLKAVLMQTSEELTKSTNPNKTELLNSVDKLLLQIDNHQLLSHLSNSSSLYLPFSWEGLEEGSIEMKKSDDGKFYCDIYLTLKEYGELNFKLTLYEKNQLNLHIYTTSKDFQNIVKENLSELRSAIIDVNVTPREIRIFEPKENKIKSAYEESDDNLAMKFEVKA